MGDPIPHSLLEKGATPRFKDIWSDTPRSIAEKEQHRAVVELLAEDNP
jgi:ankyrin repeat protein